jgi:hypothetical protein
MALLLIIPSWLFLSALVAGLCLAARRGDRQVQRSAHARPAGAGDKPATLELQGREAA